MPSFNLVIAISGLHAQITIGSDNPPIKGALLDLTEGTITKKGLGLPKVKLNASTTAGNDLKVTIDGATGVAWDKDEHIGLLVYNTSSVETQANRVCPGLHVWDGNEWQPIVAYSEVKEQEQLWAAARSYEYLDPSNPIGWPADKETERSTGKYDLGRSATNNTPNIADIQGNAYTVSRLYVGHRVTITNFSNST